MMVLPPSVLRAPKIKLELPPELADEPELLPGLTLIRCIGALNHRRDRLDAAVAKHMRLLEWRARCVKQGRDPRGRKNRVAHSEPGRVAHSEPGRVAPATG